MPLKECTTLEKGPFAFHDTANNFSFFSPQKKKERNKILRPPQGILYTLQLRPMIIFAIFPDNVNYETEKGNSPSMVTTEES